MANKNAIVIPSDYVYILLNFNGLRIDDGNSYEVLNGENEVIVEIDEVIQLEHLEGELPLIKEIEEEDSVNILTRFCPMIRTVSKIILLVGNSTENLNEIYLWNYEFYNDLTSPEKLHKIADNVLDLLNNRLKKYEH